MGSTPVCLDPPVARVVLTLAVVVSCAGGKRSGGNGFHGSFFNFDDLFADDDGDDAENGGGGGGDNGFGDFHSFFGEAGGDPFSGGLRTNVAECGFGWDAPLELSGVCCSMVVAATSIVLRERKSLPSELFWCNS